MLPAALQRSKTRGRSGKFLVGAGEAVLALGLFTDTLGRRVRVAGIDVTVLEIGVVLVGIALVAAFLKVAARKLRRTLGLGVASAVSFGVGLPTLGMALPAISAGKRVLSRVPLSRLPWFGRSRWERALAFVGGPRGLATGGVGATLLGVGAYTDHLGDTYVVFGHSLALLVLFALLSIPGVLIYGIRRP